MPNVAHQGLCVLHEHKSAHCEYGDTNDVMMEIGRSSSAGFDRMRLPVRYHCVNFLRAQDLPRDADPRNASFFCGVCDCGATFQTLVDEVPTIGGSCDDARKLFEALFKGIDASTYDTPLQIP
ncbi:hypothetical protein EDB92DRAFT_1955541 [Lactarius akahatsu]|uniref:Uncharacterized protein n=1 Tax=Lactarius akahatsu TaxID=416441 RepID=A0AAD4L3S3_9AGAM|nr:hypothetical protein EDB92DRAFT_1955541 [Lactarius akahatsu]